MRKDAGPEDPKDKCRRQDEPTNGFLSNQGAEESTKWFTEPPANKGRRRAIHALYCPSNTQGLLRDWEKCLMRE
jgi:hypothetical protein